MIIVTAYAKVKKGQEDAFLAHSRECIAETRKEEGNLSYKLLLDTETLNLFTFLEEWKSISDLNAHKEAAHFKKFGGAVAGLLDEPLEIKVYDANPFSA